MAKSKKFDLENPAPILDDEDEETIAAIDEGIRDAEADRVASAETARELLSQPDAASAHPNIKELLLGPSPRFGDILPKRGTRKTRPPIDLN
jgi:hypothetical protein